MFWGYLSAPCRPNECSERVNARHAFGVFQSGRSNASVLNVEDAVPGGRQTPGDLLMSLPEEVPFDARNIEDVATSDHVGGQTGPAELPFTVELITLPAILFK